MWTNRSQESIIINAEQFLEALSYYLLRRSVGLITIRYVPTYFCRIKKKETEYIHLCAK